QFGFQRGAFPIAEKIGDQTLSLPLWVGMNEEHVAYVADTVKKTVGPLVC
ncbi:MAG: DegT/DnrJ/EryC1/StrS family aminotransferase, partial [Magnetococcales bacterium]|nr:DegT/DnrJ/EryC1/StrS family aminotransferase [Magnetococcales bacterium]